jgi:glycosyltransferase involved in cell wall biosynthesis
MIMHIITNFTNTAGAETMLARLLRITRDERTIVVSLIGISEHNRAMVANPRVSYVSLGICSIFGMIGAPLKLKRIIRKERPSAILCWMYHAAVAGALARQFAGLRTPVFWNVRQSLDDTASFSISTKIAVMAGKLLSGLPEGIIYNSERARKLHGQRGFENRNTIVIPNGFEIPPASRVELKVPSVFGIAARLHPQKDHATFFQAAALVSQTNPNVRFRVAGSGLTLDNPFVKKLLEEARLPLSSVDLCGDVRDMSSFYGSIDALVLSSRTEGFPNVVAEAMSHGKPVVTTDVGDAAAIVGDTGWVVPSRDPASMAAAMKAVLRLSPDAYAGIAQAARARIEREYTLHAIEKKYREFLQT